MNPKRAFAPIFRISALLFLRDAPHRDAKSAWPALNLIGGSAKNPSQNHFFLLIVNTPWQPVDSCINAPESCKN